jgi:small subunit ribosomal protein S4e
MLSKMGGVYAPRPSSGPHKLRECLPLVLILRNRLKFALTRREVNMCVQKRHIKIDQKVRTDMNFPAGFQDVLSIPRTQENYRLLYDVKGRFVLHAIEEKEAQYKLCRVVRVSTANKASIGHNPFQAGKAGAIPYLVTHDGRTIRYPDPMIKANDSVKVDLKTGKILDFLKFDAGQLVMVTRGANCGRVGTIVSKEKHPGTYTIVHIKDRRGNNFATRLENVFVIGKENQEWISIPKQQGVKLSILEEKVVREKRRAK